MERGSMLRGDSRERCLILGAGVLDGFRLRAFKAVLAHEYGHLTNRDTAGGRLAISVRNRLGSAAMHIAQRGAAAWYNPAWLFLNGYHRLFLRISHGASRYQEALADRWATFAYGGASFEEGLRHVVVRSVEFDTHAKLTLREVVNQRKPLVNFYRYMPEQGMPALVEMETKEALERETSPYDSHPSFASRVAWVHALATEGDPPSDGDDAEVWSLFEEREQVELRMTAVVKNNVREAYGIAL